MRFTIVVLVLAGTGATANTEIHSCLQDDGTIAFQQKPCSEPAVNADDSSEVGESRNAGELFHKAVARIPSILQSSGMSPSSPEIQLRGLCRRFRVGEHDGKQVTGRGYVELTG
jgi:hypothetical protein